MKLAELGEFGLIGRLRKAVGVDPPETLGIGDDCAVWSVPAGQRLLVTSDLLLEGTHFCRDWTDMRRLGRKAVAVNLSDIAAMGGTPRQLVLGLGLPNQLDVASVEALLEGFLDAARDYRVHLVGGDTCRAQQFLTIAVTAFGTASPQQVIRRDSARPGDRLFVSGTLGDSALGLRLLRQGATPDPFLLQRHLDPVPRIELGRRLAASGLVTAMLDVSDGLVPDIGHLLGNQVSGALLDPSALPLSAPFKAALAEPDQQLELALYGGEDYELLFTAAAGDRKRIFQLARDAGLAVSEIGSLDNHRQGIWRQDPGGRPSLLGGAGFQHFSTEHDL